MSDEKFRAYFNRDSMQSLAHGTRIYYDVCKSTCKYRRYSWRFVGVSFWISPGASFKFSSRGFPRLVPRQFPNNFARLLPKFFQKVHPRIFRDFSWSSSRDISWWFFSATSRIILIFPPEIISRSCNRCSRFSRDFFRSFCRGFFNISSQISSENSIRNSSDIFRKPLSGNCAGYLWRSKSLNLPKGTPRRFQEQFQKEFQE